MRAKPKYQLNNTYQQQYALQCYVRRRGIGNGSAVEPRSYEHHDAKMHHNERHIYR